MEKKKSPGTSKSCFHICLYRVLVNFSVEIKYLNKKKKHLLWSVWFKGLGFKCDYVISSSFSVFLLLLFFRQTDRWSFQDSSSVFWLAFMKYKVSLGALRLLFAVWWSIDLLSLSSAGTYGPDTGWTAAFPECQERNQSPINIADQDTKVSMEYQELTLDGFDAESSNKTSMKNTGKTGKCRQIQTVCDSSPKKYHWSIMSSDIRQNVLGCVSQTHRELSWS